VTPFSFAGTYRDGRGEDPIVWRVEESARRQPPTHGPGYELHTTIRGVPVWGHDFDGLEPVDPQDPNLARLSLSSSSGELADCVLTGELPCSIERDGNQEPAVVTFCLDVRQYARAPAAAPRNLKLALTVDNTEFSVDDDWFEDGLLRLESLLPAPTRLRCCATCLYSDYSPGGHGLTAMACHRDAKEQYLSVRSKHEYWSVPVTEDVIETYLCPEYQRRVHGTGYRG
jgi:hypothetical protein